MSNAEKSGAETPEWRREGDTIVRDFATTGWPITLMFVNAIGYAAEAADHHPDLQVSWGKVRVSLSTHSAGGVTDKDFALARDIDRIAMASAKKALVRGA